MNIAIIGSNGFIGRALTKELSKKSENKLKLFGRKEESYFKDTWPYKVFDPYNSFELLEDFAGTDLIYYLASETIPTTSWGDPNLEIEKNLKPFIKFLDNISELKIKKLAFVSSAGTIYGSTMGKVNEDVNKNPFAPYGIIKLTMEYFLNYFKIKHGIQFDVFRVSNVYGPGQNTGKGLGVINTFLEKILSGGVIEVFGDGNNTRNYIYIDDVARLLSYSCFDINESNIYNVSSNATLNIKEILEIIEDIIEEPFEFSFSPERKSDNSHIDLDNSRLLGKFDFFNFTEIRDGIELTYKYLKKCN
jgi:UDP-glucose 4-epimerase